MLRELGPAAVGFGLSLEAAVRAVGATETARGIEFELILPGDSAAVHLGAHGRFMVHNALAAAAVGTLMGLPAAEIAAGLARFFPVAGRLQVSELAGGVRLIDDTYNANPASMQGALDALSALRGPHRGILVAADMRELGAGAAALHRELGRMAAARGTGKLFVCGDFSAEVAAGAAAAGMPAADIVTGSRAQIQAALELAQCIGSLSEQSWLQASLAETYAASGSSEQAYQHAQAALEIAQAYLRQPDLERAQRLLDKLERSNVDR